MNINIYFKLLYSVIHVQIRSCIQVSPNLEIKCTTYIKISPKINIFVKKNIIYYMSSCVVNSDGSGTRNWFSKIVGKSQKEEEEEN